MYFFLILERVIRKVPIITKRINSNYFLGYAYSGPIIALISSITCALEDELESLFVLSTCT